MSLWPCWGWPLLCSQNIGAGHTSPALFPGRGSAYIKYFSTRPRIFCRPAAASLDTAPRWCGRLKINKTRDQSRWRLKSSAADDPSVSQSVFTIKEKGRRRRPVNACSEYCLKCLCYCTNSPINRFQHLRGIERKLTSTIFSLFRKNLPLQYSQLRIYFTQRIFGKNLDRNYPIKLYFVRVQSVVQLF